MLPFPKDTVLHDNTPLRAITDGTFAHEVPYPVGEPPSGGLGGRPNVVVLGDFNGDSRLDLAVTLSSDRYVGVLLGNGDGTFNPQTSYDVGHQPKGLVTGDWNADCKLDLAVTNVGSATVSVFIGSGNGTTISIG